MKLIGGRAIGFDKFCPLGPCLVSTRSLPDPHVVSLQTHLNGELMQDGTAQKMIFLLAQYVCPATAF
jgi:2-keto-4-pentenoate hydratase/2-oxohepta-3-ene-1,7-dioic acid hydratase in catechol pathway